jgi:WhiB family transcriptional regulator, redox-sensing transcriptional regulator
MTAPEMDMSEAVDDALIRLRAGQTIGNVARHTGMGLPQIRAVAEAAGLAPAEGGKTYTPSPAAPASHDVDRATVFEIFGGAAAFLAGDAVPDPAPAADWKDDALCSQTDPEAFFPEKGGSTREAKRVCRGCPVRAECLTYALDRDERFGIWGGLSERERRNLKRAAPGIIAA